MTTQRHAYYFETTDDDMTPEELNEKLAQAGLQPAGTRKVAPIHDGLTMSDSLAGGIWDHETGANRCNGGCRQNGVSHVSWKDLDKSRQETFSEALAEVLNEYRAQHFDARVCLQDMDGFEGVALTWDEPV